MFAMTIIDSDAFIDMPTTARLLYYDLSMRADDDGFINSPKKICRMTGASDDDLKILVMKKFIIPFESGVVVIKHWKIHNYIRKDMYKETKYKDEKATLVLDENKAYTAACDVSVTTPLQLCDESVTSPSTQDRLGKDRLGKESIEIEEKADKPPKPPRHKYGQYSNVLLTDEDLAKLKSEFSDWEQRIERLSSYMASTGKKYSNHLATIRNWARRDAEKQPSKTQDYGDPEDFYK